MIRLIDKVIEKRLINSDNNRCINLTKDLFLKLASELQIDSPQEINYIYKDNVYEVKSCSKYNDPNIESILIDLYFSKGSNASNQWNINNLLYKNYRVKEIGAINSRITDLEADLVTQRKYLSRTLTNFEKLCDEVLSLCKIINGIKENTTYTRHDVNNIRTDFKIIATFFIIFLIWLIVSFLMEDLQMKLEHGINDECYAYLIGYITNEIHKNLKLK